MSDNIFNFISTDTLIHLDNLCVDLCDGGWVHFDNDILLDGAWDREDLLLYLLEICSVDYVDITDFSAVEVGNHLTGVLDGIINDFNIHLVWGIGESEVFKALMGWLECGNYFSIGEIKFTVLDSKDTLKFMDKYLTANRENKIGNTKASDAFGEVLVRKFFDYCKESIVGVE